jgi:hypothetical protein
MTNDEVDSIWEVAVAYTGIWLEGLTKITKNLSQPCPGPGHVLPNYPFLSGSTHNALYIWNFILESFTKIVVSLTTATETLQAAVSVHLAQYLLERNILPTQEVLRRTNLLLSVIRHGPH